MKMRKWSLTLALLAGAMSHVLGQSHAWQPQQSTLTAPWASAVAPANVHPEYPRPQMVRNKWENLNGLWQYTITGKDLGQPSQYDGQILVPFPLESALSGVKKQLQPDQNLWYRRTFTAPVLQDGAHLLLHFGAVDWEASVYINGKPAGQHTGGYTAFTIDATAFLKAGENELIVKVFDPSDRGIGPHGKQVLNPANIYYTPTSGIWQTLWTEVVPEYYISDLSITPDVDHSVVQVTVHSDASQSVTLKAAGKTFRGKTNSTITIPIRDMHLWSPDDPYLYPLTISMGKDQVKSYFGMRKISIGKDDKGIDRIMLNNQFVYNLGTLDQGFWPDGLYTAPTDEALKFDIQAIKAMGFNTIRKHIKVEPARWYYYADSIGMLVWQDMVNPNQTLPTGAKAEFEKESKEILTQLHNYPSITTWVLFNEKWGQYDQARLTNWIKTTDPSRIVNGHSGEYLYVNGKLRSPSPDAYINADMTDVHSYPNPMMSEKQIGKAQVCGEFGGIGVPVPGHQWDDLTGWGYIQATPKELEEKYAAMVAELKELKEAGLSGSIYTQPFDVEGEENGLITYDRKVIKMPLEKIRAINESLVKSEKKIQIPEALDRLQVMDVHDPDEQYPGYLAQYKAGKRDSAFLRRLVLMAIRQKDQPNATKIQGDYLNVLHQSVSKENIRFFKQVTRTSADPGFRLFRDKAEEIDSVTRPGFADKKVRDVIYSEEIVPHISGNNPNPDWDQIQIILEEKYGDEGKEFALGQAMLFYWLQEPDWEKMSKYYVLYFKMALDHSLYNINGASWDIFLHVDDRETLQFAADISKYNVENFDKSPAALDTYANLLYKLGKKSEAVELETRVLEISNNGKEFRENFTKMKLGLPTWETTSKSN